MVKALDQKRFEAFVGSSRDPSLDEFGEEVAWRANDAETLIGAVLHDFEDDDYLAVVLARDLAGRFRAFDVGPPVRAVTEATVWLEDALERHTLDGVESFPQGDEGQTLDLFTPVLPVSRLNPAFISLSMSGAFFPARAIISEMMPHYSDVDGNFVEQFQSQGFDARLWELYLYAYIVEECLYLDRSHVAPDFLVSKYGESLAIEAVIVGRTKSRRPNFAGPPSPPSREEVMEAQEDALPIRFGSPLYSKLRKEYWRLPHVKGKPLVFAIADFHDDQSMLWSQTALVNYLYGTRHEYHYDEQGQLVISPAAIATHRVGDKEIPSGYFFQPEAENVSAVLFSASGTVSKFNRLGRQAGFNSPNLVMIRTGTCHDHDPNAALPRTFSYEVDEDCSETWAEGLSMFHNPNAVQPVPEDLFPSIAHHHFQDGQIMSRLPDFHPYTSVTLLFESEGECTQ